MWAFESNLFDPFTLTSVHNLTRLWALRLFNIRSQALIHRLFFYYTYYALYIIMADEYKTNVERLVSDGSNWTTYRDRMIWSLRSRRLLEHLASSTITPAYVTAGDINHQTPQMRWENEEATAMQIIGVSIPNSVFTTVKTQTTAKGLWDALKALYEGRTTMILVKLSQQLQSTRCGDEENVCEHFDKLANLREQLAAMGKSVADNEYASILMGSLPSTYASMLGSIAASAEMSGTAVSSAIVVKLAMDEYDQRTLQSRKAQDEAFTADSQKKRKGKKRDVECENCHKKGHTKAQCWAKGGGNEGGRPKRKGKDDDKKEGDKGAKSAAAITKDEPDIEAWAAIDGTEEDDATPHVPIMAIESGVKVQTELFDSGASRHMSPNRKQFVTYREIPARPITAANNKVFHAIGMGDLQINVPNGKKSTEVLLKNALHAPDLALTVVSIGRIAKAGYTVQFAEDSCTIKKGDDGPIIGQIPVGANGLFKVEHAFAIDTSVEPVDILTLHRRLGHISVDAIRTLVRTGSITGIQLIDDLPPFTCDSCEYAKTTRKPIRKEREEKLARKFGDEVHTDVWGPSPTLSLGGRRYYVTFTDDCTRFTKLDILRTKDEAFKAYKSFSAWAQTQHGVQIKRLRSDRGGEFTSNQFTAYLREQGTERRLTTADTPQHNGVAESLNRRLLERVRAILHQADLPKNLWGEAIQFAVWLKNRTSTKALGNVTPYERLYG